MEEVINNSTELEVEQETQGEALMDKPFNPAEIDITSKSLIVATLIKRLKASPAEIDLAPAFQRKGDLWDKKKQSQLIESILIQFPLPSFYFDGSNNDNWLVVDGLQRLCALRNFMITKELNLTGLEFLTKLEGSGYDDLPRNLQRQIEETQINAYIINAGTPDDVKFNIFSRINRGGMILNPQEIRHALNQGVATKFINDLASVPEFQEMIGQYINTDRMLDKEFVTRFLAFAVVPVEDYKTDLDTFLNFGLVKLKSLSEGERDIIKSNFIESLKLCWSIFGLDAFRKISNQEGKRRPINKALFEVLSVNFAIMTTQERKKLVEHKNNFIQYFKELIDDKDSKFVSSISSATGNKTNISFRYKSIRNITQKTLAL